MNVDRSAVRSGEMGVGIPWLMQVAGACQSLASAGYGGQLTSVSEKLRQLMPEPRNVAEALILRAFLLEFFLLLETNSACDASIPRERALLLWVGARQRMKSVLSTFTKACEMLVETPEDHGEPPPWEQVHRWLETHVDASESIDGVAATFHVHPTTLRRHYKQMYGVSPSAHRRRIRLKQGIQLLVSSDLKIEAVAMMIGCRSRATFHRLVIRATGMTPSRMREASKQA